jgi:hypothetical protein
MDFFKRGSIVTAVSLRRLIQDQLEYKESARLRKNESAILARFQGFEI